MVKFSKQFEAQLVPEWKGAFVDYRQLKKDVKKIQVLRQKALATDHADTHRSLFGLDNLSHVLGFLKRKATLLINGDTEPSIIQVHRRLSGSDSAGDVYETEVLGDESEQTDGTKTFFNTLDDQLNKVNKFYVVKEKEFLERAETLKKQMLVLIELKAALKRQRQESSSHGGSRSGRNSLQSADSADVSGHGSEEGDQAGQQEQLDVIAAFENNGVTFVGSPKRRFMNGTKTGNDVNGKSLIKAKSFHGRSFNAQGRNMRMDIPITTPSRTIAAITNVLWDDLVNQSNKGYVNRKALRHAEKMIRGAFVELYRGLGFLKTYRSLNMLAFVKILKKFDKVTGQQTLPIYLKVVESSYFNSSDKVVKLSDEVEELFTKQFTDDDRGKAMKYLKPKQSKDSHTVTFFIGLFTGCFMALLIGYIIMAHIAGMYTDHRESGYMETVYPVFSMLCLLNLHILLYGCNILLWRNQRINYSFIFEFAHNTELKYQDVFLICSSYMTVVVGAMVAHLAFLAKGFSPVDVNTIPGFLLLASLALLICPFNILYRSTRFSFLGVMRNIILSPLYKVVMVDFFMADQLTSQVSLLRQLEYITCYYVTGSFKNQDYDTCNNKQYRDLVYVVSFLPYYWRAMQCARRWFDEGDINHITNLGKYVSAMLAGGARLTYEKQQTVCWCILVVITSTIATIYQLYWDFVKDWGLLQPRSCNPWLRDELILKHKIIYFMSMALNVILRLAWLQTIIRLSFESVDYRVTGFFIASLEVIRRGHWNFYRLENEHLNNAGKFRALKIVPLPFHEVDDD